MTDKDRDQYFEVLMALAGFGNYKNEENEPEENLSQFCHEKQEMLKNRHLRGV